MVLVRSRAGDERNGGCTDDYDGDSEPSCFEFVLTRCVAAAAGMRVGDRNGTLGNPTGERGLLILPGGRPQLATELAIAAHDERRRFSMSVAESAPRSEVREKRHHLVDFRRHRGRGNSTMKQKGKDGRCQQASHTSECAARPARSRREDLRKR